MPDRRPLHEVILELKEIQDQREVLADKAKDLCLELSPFLATLESYKSYLFRVGDVEFVQFYAVGCDRMCFEEPQVPKVLSLESLKWPPEPEPDPSNAFELPTADTSDSAPLEPFTDDYSGVRTSTTL